MVFFGKGWRDDMTNGNQYESIELTKELIEKQFNDLFDKARHLYPDIEENISSYSRARVHAEYLQDYFDLLMQSPLETSTNQVIAN